MPGSTALDTLKHVLTHQASAASVERLVAALVGRLLGLSVSVASAGDQAGADAGTAGNQNRHIRIEAKRYTDQTSLNRRELLGEVDLALAREPELEAWILAATREVPEQTALSLHDHAVALALPIVVIDWRTDDFPLLAALCTVDSAIVRTLISDEAADLTSAVTHLAAGARATLLANLQTWAIGFESLRSLSHEDLLRLWRAPRHSLAVLGQNAAGGASSSLIPRPTVRSSLTSWWTGHAADDSPAVLVGAEGVGKTWAALGWLVDNLSELPITLTIPASLFGQSPTAAFAGLAAPIAQQLCALTRARDTAYWLKRLDRLLHRPKPLGPAIVILVDGLNQSPHVDWLRVGQLAQDDPFSGQVRLLFTTRTHYFNDRLRRLRPLLVPVTRIAVTVYDISPGGELDQALSSEGLTRADLGHELISAARVPRLFPLVIRLRAQLTNAPHITIHRLLWEYGRDSLLGDEHRTLGSEEWREWLRVLAERYREGASSYSYRDLTTAAARPDLTQSEVLQRLSAIVDGPFLAHAAEDDFRPDPTLLYHALGVALLRHLARLGPGGGIATALDDWLDPIASLDEAAGILRAAVSICLARSTASDRAMLDPLVARWLNNQNIPPEHVEEVVALAQYLTDSLLFTLERSFETDSSAARVSCLRALHAIPRTSLSCLQLILERIAAWLSTVSRAVRPVSFAGDGYEVWRHKHFLDRLGIDQAGPVVVLGYSLTLVDQSDTSRLRLIPFLLEGFPLHHAIDVLSLAAVHVAVATEHDLWRGVRWLCILNDIDTALLTQALRNRAADLTTRTAEPAISPLLARRVASLLLGLTGETEDEPTQALLDSHIDRELSYENDYLPDPGRSLFPLERRHAAAALADDGIRLGWRLTKAQDLLLDPSFAPPLALHASLTAAAIAVDVSAVDTNRSPNDHDLALEAIEPALARVLPQLLARITRSKLINYATRPSNSRYWSAHAITGALLLVDEEVARAARALRLSAPETDPRQEAFVATQLLLAEVTSLSGKQQCEAFLSADLTMLFQDVAHVMQHLSTPDIDELIRHVSVGTTDMAAMLVRLLSVHCDPVSDLAWEWLLARALDNSFAAQGLAFELLSTIDAKRFGTVLLSRQWSWHQHTDYWIQHFGSLALIDAASDLPFDMVASNCCPWLLLYAARARGSRVAEVRLAASILDIILHRNIEAPAIPSQVEVDCEGSTATRVSVRPASDISQSAQSSDPSLATAAVASDPNLSQVARTTAERILEARRAGAELFLIHVSANDLASVLDHAPDLVDKWTTEVTEQGTSFARRVHLAEELYLRLCQCLLTTRPAQGVALWGVLRKILRTRFVGVGGVEELTHIAFSAPSTPETDGLLAQMLEPASAHSDKVLLYLSVAATLQHRQDWLAARIADDRSSTRVWRLRRGAKLLAYSSSNQLPVDGAWPAGEVQTQTAEIGRTSARMRSLEACAHHWWNSFITAAARDEAYAAWVLFVRAADRRVWTWLSLEPLQRDTVPLAGIKLSHFELNRDALDKAIAHRERELDRQYLDWTTFPGVGPWDLLIP